MGRLDLNSEGLLLLTNDGALAQKLMLPSSGWVRQYRVRVDGSITDEQIKQLNQGIVVDGEQFGRIEVKRERGSKTARNQWLLFLLKEGKNREIRRACGAIGLEVNRLIRTDYGPFALGTLESGGLYELNNKELSHVTDD